MNRFAAAIAALLLSVATGYAADIRFPADSGAINVRDFGAKGNGRDDDTKALLAAIAAAGQDTGATFWKTKILWLPKGVYCVSAPLVKRYADGRFGSGMVLVGESETDTVIKLVDHAPGYGSAAAPKGVIMTTAKLLDGSPTSGGKDYTHKGEGNDAYENFVENLTVDVGKGNPGAIGIDYLANNIGAIRDVTVEGDGAIGISMRRKWPGPALIQRVTVHGFDTGISVANTEYGMTLDRVDLNGQTHIGLENDGNAISANRLAFSGSGTPVVNRDERGLILMDHATIGEGDPENTIWAGSTQRHFDGETIPDAPADFGEPVDKWANVLKFMPPGGDPHDITKALRAAFASGAATVYLPFGTYRITEGIVIPPTLRRFVGMNATIGVSPDRTPTFMRDTGMFQVNASGASLTIDRLAFDMSNLGDQVAVQVQADRDVTLRDVVTAGTSLLSRGTQGGRVFIEDSCCGGLQTQGSAAVIARQFNTEGGGTRIAAKGTPITILGLKTEGDCTVLQAEDGARATILGGLVYIVGDADPSVPAFVVGDAKLTASFVEESLRPYSHYTTYVRGQTQVQATRFPQRGFGRMVPWLMSGH
jgi:hypothetical protein